MHIGGEPVFCYWQKFAKFQPEKYDFDQYKGFLVENFVQIRQIFYDKFQ